MNAVFFVDFISLVVLTAAFFVLWKERKSFYSLNPFLPAVIFLILSRIFDILIEHPSFQLSEYFNLPAGSLEPVLATAGNIFDTVSFTLLVYGFLKIVNHRQEQEKHIETLEKMLPLCANCKKYRTPEGQWLPIEKYLRNSGAPPVSHGICPECSQLLYSDILNKNLPEDLQV
jgi:hypothetical protein